jgi:hypothetical protein
MEAESSQSESENWSIGEDAESMLSLSSLRQSRKSRLTNLFNSLLALNE